ncbi:MAG: HDIG domain-containing protein [Verrucomicrobia bacterium]|nr:HDIG domain-containing protein [Verrucomicrobiota bacterium]
MKISKSRAKRAKQLEQNSQQRTRQPKSFKWTGLALGLLLWLSALMLLYSNGARRHTTLAPGQRAKATVVSAIDFECEDVAKTELTRRQAANAVLPVFSINMIPFNSAVNSFDVALDRIIELRAVPAENTDADGVAEAPPPDVTGYSDLESDELLTLVTKGRENHLRAALKEELSSVWHRGILSPSEKKTLFQGVATSGRLAILSADGASKRSVPIENVLLPEQALAQTVAGVQKLMKGNHVDEELLTRFIRPSIVANLIYEPDLTKNLRTEAERSVAPILMTVRAGTTLVEAGERITPQILKQLQSHDKTLSQNLSKYDLLLRMVGSGALLLLTLLACTGIIHLLKPDILSKNRTVLLLVILALLGLTPARALLYLSNTIRTVPPAVVEFLVPVALTALLAAVLVGGAAALVAGIWTSMATAILFDNSFPVFVYGMVATVVAVHTVRDVRKRSRVFRGGLWIGLAGMLVAASVGVLQQHSVSVVLLQAVAGFLCGSICAVLTLLILPLLEYLFGITTDIRLLELSDMGHPLLQRLALEAPGTYHHSLMVSNVAQAAAEQIGANALLTRVCAYFHDIGKLTKPEFFTENSQHRDNPHDDLSPSMSTLVITSHVKEGVSLAKRHKLPTPIIDAIQQHHGTGIVSYFYHRAKKQQDVKKEGAGKANGRAVKEEDFRYAGPKPQSREMAILLLADSVEAASRSMEKSTPSRIENLVNEIVDSRLADHQLDESHLTLSELSTIKKAFVFSLTNMLHGRVAYPQDEDRNKQQPAETSDTAGRTQEIPAASDGTGSPGR